MVGTRREYWVDNFKQGRISAWEWMGIKGLIIDVLVGLLAGFIISRTISERQQLLVFFGVSILVIITIFIVTFLFFAIIAIPFDKHKEQTRQIAKLKSSADRLAIVNEIVALRKEGVALRNRGNKFTHQSSVDTWWEEHLEWRNKTINTIGLLDENIAAKWSVLDTYTPKRPFPGAYSPDHRRKLQMFDAWLERLVDVIEELKSI